MIPQKQSGFARSGLNASGFGTTGFGTSGFGTSGFGTSGFGTTGFGTTEFGTTQLDTPHLAASDFTRSETDAAQSRDYPSVAASAAMVNRTHRIVRERARTLQERRSRARSLWIPVGVSAGLIAVLVFAVWSLLDQYEAAPTGLPDASQQIFVLLLWCLPVSAGLLAAVWVRHSGKTGGENAQ